MPASATTPAPIGFSPVTAFDTGGYGWGTQIADVTGDGRQDLIVTNHGGIYGTTGFAVLVYAQQAGGGLATTPAVYEPSSEPVGTEFWLYPATGDLNGDGKLDLAVGHEGGLDVFLQSGGLLTGPTAFATTGTVYGIQIADLNGDARQDIVYAVWSDTLGEYRYLRRFQLVGGTLGSPVALGTGMARRFQIGDVTADGRPDIVLEDEYLAALRYFSHDAGAQTFTAVEDDRFAMVGSVGIADVTGDGRNDLIGTASSSAWVAAGKADGSLADPSDIVANLASVYAVEVGDLNGDAMNDVTVFSTTGVRVALGDATGGLSFACSFPPVVDSPWGGEETAAVGDIDGDGLIDAVGAWQADGVRLLSGVASGSKTPSQMTLGFQGGSTFIGDEFTLFAQMNLETGVCMPSRIKLWRRNPDLSSSVIATYDPLDMGDGLTFVAAPTDTPPATGTYSYKVTWPGDAFHSAGNSDWLDLDITNRTADLVVNPVPSGIYIGDSSTLQVWLYGGPPEGQEVALFRRADGGDVSLGTVQTDDNGYGSLVTTPDVTSTYYATWGGATGWNPATSADATVNVYKRSTSLRLDVSSRTIVFGHGTTLQAKLKGGDPATRAVSFYRVTSSGVRLLETVAADAQGNASLAVKPKSETTYVAKYAGDDIWASANSAKLQINVRVVVSGAMTHTKTFVGDTASYPCCRAWYRFGVDPNHAGKPVSITVWVDASGWKNLGSQGFRLNDHSGGEIYIDINGGAGYRFRVRTCFKGDSDHVGACSSFDFFRYTGTRARSALSWRAAA